MVQKYRDVRMIIYIVCMCYVEVQACVQKPSLFENSINFALQKRQNGAVHMCAIAVVLRLHLP